MLFCRMICLWPQNMPQFPISLLHWSQISFSGAFFWGLQIASSHWRIGCMQKQFKVQFLLCCDQLLTRCIVLVKENSSSFVAVFCRFLSSNVLMMLYNICYWWFFLSQGNQWNTLHIPKYGGQNLACWCLHLWLLLMAFTCCCPLSWLLIWLWCEVVDPCFIHRHIFTQKLLFVVLKQL